MMVADTDVLIDALNAAEPALTQVDRGLRSGQLATTAICSFELLAGARTARQRKAVATLLAPMEILPVDSVAAATAADIRRELEAAGRGIGMGDYLVAAVCVARGLPLLTRNQGHFGRVAALRLVPSIPS
jgi:predicted nucleic acid-binding protein